MQFKGKINYHTLENDEKLNFGPDFGPCSSNLDPQWVLPLLDVRYCRKLSLYVISRKTYNPIWKMAKDLILVLIWVLWVQIWAANFFHKSWLCQSLDIYHSQLSLCTIWEKTDDPILRKCSDGRTDGRADEQTVGREWFHRTLPV